MEVSREETQHMCLDGTPPVSMMMQTAQLPQVTEFKYLGSTLQSDRGANKEVSKRTQCGWNSCRKVSRRVLFDKRIAPRLTIHHYGLEKAIFAASVYLNEMRSIKYGAVHVARSAD